MYYQACLENKPLTNTFTRLEEQKIKTDDQGIGAFRAAQAPEQKPTIGKKYTDDDIPWAEPVTAGDTITGPTSQDVYNAQQSGYPGQGMTSREYREKPEKRRMGQVHEQYHEGD
jgi:hypothetical protein